MIGLHGGGRGGKDGKAVVGSGPSAMNFYQRGAERLGVDRRVPDRDRGAVERRSRTTASCWRCSRRSQLLFNVDTNRIYLTGHSMGGFGTWHFGPQYAHLWAAISPMAGGGGGSGLKRLRTR